VWVGSTWISYVDNANFRRFSTQRHRSCCVCLLLKSWLKSVQMTFIVSGGALNSTHLHLLTRRRRRRRSLQQPITVGYASRAPPVPTHPVVCVSSLSHMKEVCVPSHNRRLTPINQSINQFLLVFCIPHFFLDPPLIYTFAQWRRLDRARGARAPTFTNDWARGTP